MNLVDYIVPVTVFIVLLASSWDWLWKANSKRPTGRGWLVILCGLVALFYGWHQFRADIDENRKLLETVERQSQRLEPSDFQLKLETWAHGSAILEGGQNYSPPERLSLHLSIGDIRISGAFVLREGVAREHLSSRSPNKYWNYYGTDLYVDGLSQVRYLDQLEGETISLYVPRRALGAPFSRKKSGIRASISIKGHEFEVKHESLKSGEVETKIHLGTFTIDDA